MERYRAPLYRGLYRMQFFGYVRLRPRGERQCQGEQLLASSKWKNERFAGLVHT